MNDPMRNNLIKKKRKGAPMGKPEPNPAKKTAPKVVEPQSAPTVTPETSKKNLWSSFKDYIGGKRKTPSPTTIKGAVIGILIEQFKSYFHPAPTILIDDILLMRDKKAQEKILACLEKAWKDLSFPAVVKALMKATEGVQDRTERQKILAKLANLSDGEDFRPLIKIVSTGFFARIFLEESEEAEKVRAKIKVPVQKALSTVEPSIGCFAEEYAAKTGADQTPFGAWLKRTRQSLEKEGTDGQ
jgi:hypothetical protein